MRDSLHVNDINGAANEFTVIGHDLIAKVNLLNKICSCREYDLVKMSCANSMVALRLKYGDEYGSSIYEYSSPMYKVKLYLLAYDKIIYLVPSE